MSPCERLISILRMQWILRSAKKNCHFLRQYLRNMLRITKHRTKRLLRPCNKGFLVLYSFVFKTWTNVPFCAIWDNKKVKLSP
jgi:hypothetical protein